VAVADLSSFTLELEGM